ncbi:MAG TPA: IS66 family transposase [Opitutaceae bacterium]
MITDDPNPPSALIDALRRENERLHTSLRQSNTQLAEASSQAELLRAERNEFLEQLKHKDREIDSLQHQLQALLRRYYGRSSEKMDPKQKLLFEDLIDKAIPETPAEEASEAEAVSDEMVSKRRGHGRRRLPLDLPREKVIHDLPEDEKPCPCCGTCRHIIGKETSEQLDYVPAKVKVIEHIRLKYGCPTCEASASEAGPQIVTADKPLSPIDKGLAAPGLLSYVMVSKYGDHLPLHRLEGILKRHAIEIARSTMCDWAAQCADLLRPLVDLMQRRVLQSSVIHTDDTPVKVRDRNLARTRTGRFWVYLGDEDHPYTVFAYTPSRSRDGPMRFLKGWGQDDRVYLQADAFGGYDGIYAGDAGGRVTEVACWAHARRKFYDARNSDPATSTQALAYIRLLYDVEVRAKASVKREGIDPVSQRHRRREAFTSARYRLRQESAVPRLARFKAWLESQQADRGGPVLPKSPMGQAIQYALNQWEALCVYTTDGRLAIDNNASENALRRVAIGRKNWLFAGSDKGGRTAATLFSLIATCQRHQVEPFSYLRDVLTRIAATPISRLDPFLPDRWNPANTPAN